MMPKRLALLIPAYNAADFLPRLLESARAQSVPFDEIVVYDDASNDGTAELAQRFGASVIKGAINLGCSHGKNRLARHTTCEWMHFHDADDALKAGFSERARRWMAKDTSDVVLFAYEEIDDITGASVGTRKFDARALEIDPVAYAISHQINPFCGLYRKSAFLLAGGYDVDPLVLYNEDVAMHIRLALAGLRFSADDAVEIVNYRRQGSMSAANSAKCVAAQYHVLRKAMDSTTPIHHPAIARRLWEVAGVAASLGDWKTADSSACLASRLGPPPKRGLFRALCWLSPRLALRAREHAIRSVRPEFRGGSST
jgi:glycosyltransferase involved in cell wall biosynthesis